MEGGPEALSGDTDMLIAVVAVALIFDLLNGFHDGCNAVSTVIYTKAPQAAHRHRALRDLQLRSAPWSMGVAVAKTIGGVIKAEQIADRPNWSSPPCSGPACGRSSPGCGLCR